MSGIVIENVTKRYGDVTAVKNARMTFEENKIYGLLGRNGAGKSTLLNMITNKIYPSEGRILLDDAPVRENDRALSRIHLMSEQNPYPSTMKVRDVFNWSREFYEGFRADYAEELREKFGLNPNKKTGGLSTGYGSILKIIVALACETPFVLLDEPVLGLDANHRDLFYRELIANYTERPKTFILSTHLIEEVSSLIEEMVIIKNGEVLLQEPVETVLAKGYTVTGPAPLVDQYAQGKNVLGSDSLGGLKSTSIMGKTDKAALPAGLETGRLDLQKMFIYLTNA